MNDLMENHGFNMKDPMAARLVDENRRAVERKMASLSPAGALGLPDLLDKRRLEFGIVDEAFSRQCAFDRCYVYQINQPWVDEGKIGSIVLTQVTTENEQDKAHRGVLVNAGLTALEQLASHGIGLGHIVHFAFFSPLRHHFEKTESESVVVLHAGSIISSEDTRAMLRSGELKLKTRKIDGVWRYFYADANGEEWHPEAAFQPPEY